MTHSRSKTIRTKYRCRESILLQQGSKLFFWRKRLMCYNIAFIVKLETGNWNHPLKYVRVIMTSQVWVTQLRMQDTTAIECICILL